MEALKAWNGHNRIGSIFNSRASPNQQGLIHPFCWVPMFFGISFSESFRFLTIRGNIQNPTSGNMDLGGLGGRTSRSPISCAAFKAASQVSLRCRLGNFLLPKNAHHQTSYAPPAQHYEPVFAVEVKGSLAPGAPMQWILWSNNPTICQEEKTFCHALLLMKNQTLSWEVTTLAFAFFDKTMLYVQHQDRRTALCSKFVQISQI